MIMDSNHDSKSSSEETDKSEQVSDHGVGTGRSYECVFCKRGFTTAQALGGHMNIHRKERSKPRPSSLIPSISSSKVDDDQDKNCNGSFRGYPPFQSHYPTSSFHEVHINYQSFFPASSSSSSWDVRPTTSVSHGYYGDNYVYVQRPDHEQHLNPYLSLQIGPTSSIGDHDNHEKFEDDGISEADDDEELDLELRLGHDP